jgi:hypothetical protein
LEFIIFYVGLLDNYFEIWQGLNRVLSTEFDSCIIGYCSDTYRPVYSAKKMAKIVKKIPDLHEYEAIDFVINTMTQPNAENSPIICIDFNN